MDKAGAQVLVGGWAGRRNFIFPVLNDRHRANDLTFHPKESNAKSPQGNWRKPNDKPALPKKYSAEEAQKNIRAILGDMEEEEKSKLKIMDFEEEE